MENAVEVKQLSTALFGTRSQQQRRHRKHQQSKKPQPRQQPGASNAQQRVCVDFCGVLGLEEDEARLAQQQTTRCKPTAKAAPPSCKPRSQAVGIDTLYMLARVGIYDDDGDERDHARRECGGGGGGGGRGSSIRRSGDGGVSNSGSRCSGTGTGGSGGGHSQQPAGLAVDSLRTLLGENGATGTASKARAVARIGRGPAPAAISRMRGGDNGSVPTQALPTLLGFERLPRGRPVVKLDPACDDD